MKVDITFGTDGYRGIIASEFTYETVERIINAINLYLKSLNSQKNTVIVGYDPRFMAHEFAKFCARLLKDFGFRVVLSSRIVPTPIVAYHAKYYPDSLGAIMLTASHNPPDYQGIKFIPNYGGPATSDITNEILKYVDKPASKSQQGEIVEEDLAQEYFKHIENIIDFKIIRKNQPKIIFDGLYSSSIGYFDELLKRNGILFESFNMHHDPLFGGGLPEPKEKFMHHRKDGYITVANDGDADRYGVIDEKGNYISPNIILSMLLKYLSQKGYKGAMIKTVGVSNIVDVVSKKLDIKTITTPVGFKWLGAAMRQNETILAGEDSGGLSTGFHISEKDGIYANLLIIEMMSALNKPLYKLVDEIYEFAGAKFYTDRVDVKLKNKNIADKILKEYSAIKSVKDFQVKEKLELDGIKLQLNKGLTTLLIRKSGTEPLLRFYIESDNIDYLNELKKIIQEEYSK